MRIDEFTRAVLLVTLGSLPSVASAFPSYGTSVDSTCTANGWVPAMPFNPNQVANPTPSTANCGLCHVNASSPNAKLTSAGQTFKASGYTDVSPFCQPPATNGAPSFAPVAAQQATAGQLFQLIVRATDPDKNALTLAASNVPAGATFTDRHDGSGLFAWTPAPTQTGNFVVRFLATDSGSPPASASRSAAGAHSERISRPSWRRAEWSRRSAARRAPRSP
jgi:hypothetical protein